MLLYWSATKVLSLAFLSLVVSSFKTCVTVCCFKGLSMGHTHCLRGTSAHAQQTTTALLVHNVPAVSVLHGQLGGLELRIGPGWKLVSPPAMPKSCNGQ